MYKLEWDNLTSPPSMNYCWRNLRKCKPNFHQYLINISILYKDLWHVSFQWKVEIPLLDITSVGCDKNYGYPQFELAAGSYFVERSKRAYRNKKGTMTTLNVLHPFKRKVNIYSALAPSLRAFFFKKSWHISYDSMYIRKVEKVTDSSWAPSCDKRRTQAISVIARILPTTILSWDSGWRFNVVKNVLLILKEIGKNSAQSYGTLASLFWDIS